MANLVTEIQSTQGVKVLLTHTLDAQENDNDESGMGQQINPQLVF